MKHFLACATVAVVAMAAPAQSATIMSDFSDGTQGWRFATFQFHPNSYQQAVHDPARGVIQRQHGWQHGGFMASDAYLGNKSDFIGGTFSFDIAADFVSPDHAGARPALILVGANGKQLFSNWGDSPGTELTSFSITLSADSFYKGSPTSVGGAVSAAEFAEIMGNLEKISIFGDWSGGVDLVTLDNVIMQSASAVPEPASWAMMVTGFGMMGFAARRRRMQLHAA